MSAVTFCGASVTGFNSRLGWGQNKSSLDISVIEDIKNSDFFNPPPLGTPCYFTFGAYRFWGILQNWEKQNSKEGLGIYNLHVEDPRDLLAGTQVILGGYNGAVSAVANILNVYGWYEQELGYGGSRLNEGGMPWSLVATAIQSLTNDIPGAMGGPLRYRGISYAVDLSNLPIPPADYRVSGPVTNLLDLIQLVCEDGGADFFVSLDVVGQVPTIRIYTVNRYAQPPLGTIALLTNTNWGGTVVRSNNGIELRNDPTSHFVIGGPTQDLYGTSALTPFWGYDINGNVIENIIVNIPGLGYCNAAYVNCAEIAGAFNNGAISYFLTEFEMRAVLDELPGSWEQYIVYETSVLNSNKASSIGPIGIVADIGIPLNPNAKVLADFMVTLTSKDSSDAQNFAQDQLREFVRKIAQNWYGKKYWVSLPFVTEYIDPETLVISHSNEISDGGWVEGGTPLGLSIENILKFQTDDGRYEAFATYIPLGIDLENVSADDSALQDNFFYTKIQIDNAIYNRGILGIPSVLITINNPVMQQIAHIGGDLGVLGVIFEKNDNDVWETFQGRRAFGAFHTTVAAPRLHPVNVAIPLRSNISTYGPWYFAGAPGAVIVDQAEDLTPWNYNGTANMNAAALARVTSAVTFMQIGELGTLELAGLPLTSLGNRLLAGGPEITNIEVHYGAEGMTTSYQFRTFSELHLNRFTKGLDERIRRTVRTQNEIRKAALLALSTNINNTDVIAQAQGTNLQRWPKSEVAWSTPAPVFIASAVYDSGTDRVRTSTAVTDAMEGWGGIGPTFNDNGLFMNSSLVGVSAIIRPFDCKNQGLSTYLPKPVVPISISGITFHNLNPYNLGYTDVEYLSTGASVTGAAFLTYQNIDWNNIRAVGLSAPIIAVGWGCDINGNLTPSQLKPQNLNVGPIDLLWDMNRGVWTVHDTIFGKLNSPCLPSGGTSTMTIYDGLTPTNKQLSVTNYYSVPVSGVFITATYLAYSNKWMITSADCV